MFERLFVHCAKLRDHGMVKYVVIFSAISFVLSYLADRILWLFNLSDRSSLEDLPLPILFALTVLVSPLIETFLFQFLPVAIAKHFDYKRLIQFFAASIPFALAHLLGNLASGLSAGIIGGIVCGLTFVVWSGNSSRSAFWVTTTVHSLHNLGFFLVFLFLPLSSKI